MADEKRMLGEGFYVLQFTRDFSHFVSPFPFVSIKFMKEKAIMERQKKGAIQEG
jgi:hypothetical protein